MQRILAYFVLVVGLEAGGLTAQTYFPPVPAASGPWETVSPASLGWCPDAVDDLHAFAAATATAALPVGFATALSPAADGLTDEGDDDDDASSCSAHQPMPTRQLAATSMERILAVMPTRLSVRRCRGTTATQAPRRPG